jgi:hypothetical protein
MAIRIRPKAGEKHLEKDATLAVKLASSRPWIVSGLALSNGSGLNASIGAGLAWIDGYVIEIDAAEPATCAASDTNHIFLELAVDGNDLVTGLNIVVNTSGTAPSGPHVKLGTATTDGSSVTGTATTGRSPEIQADPIPTGAVEISYDNSTSGLAATDVEGALNELAARPASGGWTAIGGTSTDVARTNNTQTTVYSVALEANKTYEIELTIFVDGASGSMSLQVPSGASATGSVIIMSAWGSDSFGGNQMKALENRNLTSTISGLNYSGSYRTLVTIVGVITTGGTAGNCNVRFANGGSGTLNVRQGSNIKIKDVTP